MSEGGRSPASEAGCRSLTAVDRYELSAHGRLEEPCVTASTEAMVPRTEEEADSNDWLASATALTVESDDRRRRGRTGSVPGHGRVGGAGAVRADLDLLRRLPRHSRVLDLLDRGSR